MACGSLAACIVYEWSEKHTGRSLKISFATSTPAQSGATVATISLDRSDTGTITYAAGGTSAVDDWVIVD